jgi:starch synthase
MAAAIDYHREAYSTSGLKLMGRNAAGESFLRGFFAHVTTEETWVQVQTADHAKSFAHAPLSSGNSRFHRLPRLPHSI